MQDRSRGDAGRSTKIRVDSYEHGVPTGRFCNYGQDGGSTDSAGLSRLGFCRNDIKSTT